MHARWGRDEENLTVLRIAEFTEEVMGKLRYFDNQFVWKGSLQHENHRVAFEAREALYPMQVEWQALDLRIPEYARRSAPALILYHSTSHLPRSQALFQSLHIATLEAPGIAVEVLLSPLTVRTLQPCPTYNHHARVWNWRTTGLGSLVSPQHEMPRWLHLRLTLNVQNARTVKSTSRMLQKANKAVTLPRFPSQESRE